MVLLVAMPQEAQYLVHFSAFQSLAAAEEVVVFLAQMRLLTLPVINNKMDRRVVLAAVALVMDHQWLYLTEPERACPEKVNLAAQAVMPRRQPP